MEAFLEELLKFLFLGKRSTLGLGYVALRAMYDEYRKKNKGAPTFLARSSTPPGGLAKEEKRAWSSPHTRGGREVTIIYMLRTHPTCWGGSSVCLGAQRVVSFEG